MALRQASCSAVGLVRSSVIIGLGRLFRAGGEFAAIHSRALVRKASRAVPPKYAISKSLLEITVSKNLSLSRAEPSRGPGTRGRFSSGGPWVRIGSSAVRDDVSYHRYPIAPASPPANPGCAWR